jgi:hypothetical protein
MRAVYIFLLLLTVGCQTREPKQNTYISPEYDAGSYAQVAWDPKSPVIMMGVLYGSEPKALKQRIIQLTQAALEERGFEFVEADQQPDLLISIAAGLSEASSFSEHSVTQNTLDHNDTIMWQQTNDFYRGGLAIQLVSAATGEDVWRGAARNKISESEMRRQSGTAINDLLDTILANLPAPPRS